MNSEAAKFIHFSVDFAESIFPKCPAFARLPFQLIDDFLEDKNISQAKEIWPLLEGLAEKLTTETLFPKGKFIMLKTCNFLLKKLSKSCDTEVFHSMYGCQRDPRSHTCFQKIVLWSCTAIFGGDLSYF
jgi:hypothetical protein